MNGSQILNGLFAIGRIMDSAGRIMDSAERTAQTVDMRTRVAHMGTSALAPTASLSAGELRLQCECQQNDIEKLLIITQALWELLKKEHGYSDEVLLKKVTEIDMSDGRLDGKVAKVERPNCVSCGRKLGRLPTCIYCGTITPRNPFER